MAPWTRTPRLSPGSAPLSILGVRLDARGFGIPGPTASRGVLAFSGFVDLLAQFLEYLYRRPGSLRSSPWPMAPTAVTATPRRLGGTCDLAVLLAMVPGRTKSNLLCRTRLLSQR